MYTTFQISHLASAPPERVVEALETLEARPVIEKTLHAYSAEDTCRVIEMLANEPEHTVQIEDDR